MPPRLARLLAAVVAIALVAGAFLVRGALTDDDETVSATATGDVPAAPDAEATYRLICDEDLGEAACAAVAELPGVDEVEVMAGGEVLDAEPAEIATFDAWLTLDPMPDVLDEARTLAGDEPVTSGRAAVVTASLSLLEIEGRFACEEVDWVCLVEAADSQKVGLPTADGTAGLVAAASALLALVPDLDRVGLQRQDDALAELDVLFERSDDLQDQHTTMITARGTYAGIVTTTLLAERGSGRRSGFAARPLTPAVTVRVVLAGLGDGGERAVAALLEGITDQTVAEALAEGGWAGGTGSPSILPAADLIYALREELG